MALCALPKGSASTELMAWLIFSDIWSILLTHGCFEVVEFDDLLEFRVDRLN